MPGSWSSPVLVKVLDCFDSEVGGERCFEDLELALQSAQIVDFVEGEAVLTQNQVIKAEFQMALGLRELRRTFFGVTIVSARYFF